MTTRPKIASCGNHYLLERDWWEAFLKPRKDGDDATIVTMTMTKDMFVVIVLVSVAIEK